MTPADVPTIDADRLFDKIARSAGIGRFRGTGLRRLALTPADKQMRDELVAWARAAGCAVAIDPASNIFARRRGTAARRPIFAG